MGMEGKTDNLFMASAFGTLNKILRYIERQLDNEDFDAGHFTAAEFSVSEERFARYLAMLSDSGYVTGIRVADNGERSPFDTGRFRRFDVTLESPSITVKGLQFLAENTVMAKMYAGVKGLRDLMP